MTWFKYLNNNSIIQSIPSTPNYLTSPLKRNINIPALEDPIHANDWLFVEKNNQNINIIYNRDLSIEEQDHSYIVICENQINESDATPTRTIIVDDYIYFKSPKNHEVGTVNNYEYNLYYGKDYLKYLKATPSYSAEIEDYQIVYIQESNEKINYYLTQNNSQNYAAYSATPSSVDYYQHLIDDNSSGKYLMTFFNNGIDWINNTSVKSGSKITANFDGPNIKVMGYTGPEYGKIKYRVIEKNSNNEIVVIDWKTIDCYSTQSLYKDIININSLSNLEHIIEIETIPDKNVLSSGYTIKINQIRFLRNFKLSLGEELINPDLSFVSIGGIR